MVRATREVILSLGSLNTPKVLQLSGIGPRSVLNAAGVAVHLDRENVGRGLHEHRCATLRLQLNEDLGYNRLLSSSVAQALTAARYLATRKGPLAAPSFDIVGFVKSEPDVERPDGQIMLGPWTIPPYNLGEPVAIERQAGVSCLGMVLRPTSEGSIEITSADPSAPLRIDPNYLDTDYDRTTTANLLRTMRGIFEQSPIAERISHETFPGPSVLSDSDWSTRCWMGATAAITPAGTCAMGPSDDDVVDDSYGCAVSTGCASSTVRCCPPWSRQPQRPDDGDGLARSGCDPRRSVTDTVVDTSWRSPRRPATRPTGHASGAVLERRLLDAELEPPRRQREAPLHGSRPLVLQITAVVGMDSGPVRSYSR